MYKKLHEVFKEIKREAKGSDVKKQINSLRLNHRRELNKMKCSKCDRKTILNEHNL